jgi:DNA gyrase subunit A
MAKQLNLLSAGKVIAISLHTEMEQSYLEYAMSVIVGRALPDVRDGLKPVHRRILYAMHELGLTPDRPYRKCARVVGDVLGKYHPHGDQAVYDALVRMVQSFSSRYPLLDGHGNFGSVDDDPPAAMRYTETRLSGIGNETLLAEVGESTVDFTGNFDNSQQEPLVLPAQLPTLLLNGCSGIAVGMATNIPPHNLSEVVDGLIALIDRPHLTTEELMAIIPGPDFPTGGEIVGSEGITEAYTTGRGSIAVRGVAQFEELQPGKGRHRRTAIVITEIPFQVNKAALLEKMATLINQDKLEGIADLRDESDREGMRIVIELRRDVQPEAVLEQLYRQTALQNTFGVILLCLVNGQPRQLSLKEMLQEFLAFREETLTRRYRYELEQSQNRQHLLDGLLIALDNLDTLIDILRQAPDGSTAKLGLQTEFDLSDRQADAILGMPMRRLTGMEQQNLRKEHETLTEQITQLERLLGDRKELLKALKQDLRTLKRKFGDTRRTQIQAATAAALVASAIVEEGPVQLELTQRGYVRTQRISNRGRRKAEERSAQLQENERDLTIYKQISQLDERLLTFMTSGKAYAVNLRDIPISLGRDRGTPLVTLLSESAQSETLAAQFLPVDYDETCDRFVFLTQQGRLKWLLSQEFDELTGRGLGAIKLKEEDALGWVVPAEAGSEIVVATAMARLLRFPLQAVPEMGRAALGNTVLRLLKQETMAGLLALETDADVLLFSRFGYVRQVALQSLRQGQPGHLGTPVWTFAKKTDSVIALVALQPDQDVMVVTDQNRVAYLNLSDLPDASARPSGAPWVKIKSGEKVVQVIPLKSEASPS